MLTFWTKTKKLNPASGNPVSFFLCRFEMRGCVTRMRNIVNPLALGAKDVVMLAWVPIEPFLSTADLQFFYETCLGKDFQIPVHCC